MDIYPEIAAWADEMIAIRRDFHMHPELGFEETRTSGIIAEKLRSFGIEEVAEHVGEFGVVAAIRGTKAPSSACVGLRADFDALPLQETSGLPWASTIPGKAHSCGHDGHAATLLTVARYLHAKRDTFAGTVVCVFQHAEETERSGAKAIVEDGLFERWPIQEMFMFHDYPALPVGDAGIGQAGPHHAASDCFKITVRGKGGHGGRPHLSRDPLVALNQAYHAVQTIASRSIDALHPLAISVGAIECGDMRAGNIIADVGSLKGTVRTHDPRDQEIIERRLGEICRGVGRAFGAELTLEYIHEIPGTFNDAGLCEAVPPVMETVFGKGHVHTDIPRTTGAEDFAYYMQRVPGLIIRVGNADENHPWTCHNPHFEFNDRILAPAATMMARIALTRLAARSE